MKLRNLFRLPAFVVVFAGLSFTFVGCDVKESSEASEEDSDGDSDSDSDSDVAIEDFKIYAEASSAQYSLVVSKDGDGEDACVPTASNQEITCIIDMDELDLFHRGVTIKATVPADVCKYMEFKPYYFNVAPFSLRTPYLVLYQTDDGELVAPPGGADPDVYYGILDNTGAATLISHEDLYGAPATGPDEARCMWDYSEVATVFGGKNCCVGPYFKNGIVRTGIDDDADGTIDRYEVENDQGYEDWGGSVDACMRGSGIENWTPRNRYGYPISLIYPVEAEGLAHEFEMTSPIELEFQEQIYVSNYYSGTAPAALRDGYSFYRYDCLDNNKEVLFRVNVQIREWNEAGELAKILTNGDPDTTGNEDTPFGSLPINDYSDWGDITPALELDSFGFDDPGAGAYPALDYLDVIYDGNSAWIGFNPD